MRHPFRLLYLLTISIMGSWILLHILAFLGVFLGLAYPIWWLLMPRYTLCIGCNAWNPGANCPFCHSPVTKSTPHPKTFISAVRNSLAIITISIVSLGLVYLETKVLYLLGIPATPKTAEFVIPPKGQYLLGEVFPLKIELVGLTTPINAVQVDLGFDPRRLAVQEISTAESFANIFIQKEINNEVGYARLTGGLPNPGFFSDRGLFGTVYLKALEPGIATVEYLPTSIVLANDGRGTNVLKDFGTINYLILPEKISTENDFDQSAIFNVSVLGESTGPDQLVFFSEADSVLGTSSARPPSPQSVTENWFLNLIAKINDHILRFWGRFLSLIQGVSS